MSVLQIFRGDDFLEEVVLARAVMGLGRHPQNDIVLDDRSLSRFHARVERRGDTFVVVDCGAQNGVHLNGERVVGESNLTPGDRITLGRYVAVFDIAQRGAAKPKFDLNKAAPDEANGNGHNGNGHNGHNGKNGSKKPSLDAEIEALEIDDGGDVDVDMDVDVDEGDRTQRAKHKELAEKDKEKTGLDKTAKKKPEPTLVLLFNGMEVSRHPVPTDGLTIGRSKQSDVVISLLGLSRKHAQIRRTKDGITVEDLGSQNGTWVNNQRIAGQKKLKHGDLMNFYDYAVLFLEDGDVDVGFPGGTFPQPGDTDVGASDDLANRETNRSSPQPIPANVKRPPTARSLVPLADSAQGKRPVASGHVGKNGSSSAVHSSSRVSALSASPATHAAPAGDLNLGSASELVDLGEGSFLGDEFEEEAKAKKGDGTPGPSSLLEEDALDDVGLEGLDELDDRIDDDLAERIGGGGTRTNATDVVKDLRLGSDLKNADLDAAGGFEGGAGTEGDHGKFDDKTSASIGSGHGRAWASDDDVLEALSNSPDSVMVTLEVQLGGKAYTQMPLSQTVTRVGTDARCELSLPKSSGLMPWHLTLMHLGGTVVLYRAAKAARIQLAEGDIDMAIIKDGDMLDLGKVRVKIRMK